MPKQNVVPKGVLRECVARVRMMRFFPGGGDPDVVAVLAGDIRDAAAEANLDGLSLKAAVIQFTRQHGEWPGTEMLRIAINPPKREKDFDTSRYE